jgi:hypothetical protein
MPIPPGPATTNSISQTATALINSALRLIGVLASGETADINSANDALVVLNQMLDSWNAERLTIFTTASQDFALTLGKQAYTLGSGGDFDTTRPARIDSMSAILLNNPANPIEEPMDMLSVEEWQTRFPVKNVNGSFPTACYDDGGFPLRTLSFYPIPINQAVSIRIYAWQPLTLASSLQAVLNFPPGYAEAFRYNLAVRLAPEFQAALRPEVAQIAIQSKATLKTMNAPDLSIQSDLLSPADGYNYAADMFGLPYSGVPRG